MILQLIYASFGLIVSTSRNHHNLAQSALSGYQSLLRKRSILLAPTEILPTLRIVELDGLAIHPLLPPLLRPPPSSRPLAHRIFGANSRPLFPPLLLRSQSPASPRLPRPLSAPGHARSSLLPSLHCPSLSEYGFFPPPLSVGPSLPRPSGASFPPSFFAFRCTCSLPYPSFVPWDGRPLPLSLGDPPYVTFTKGSSFPDQLPSSTRSILLVGQA